MGLLGAIQPSADGGMGLLGSVLSRIDAMKRRAVGLFAPGGAEQLLASVAEDARANADLAGQGYDNSQSVMAGMAQLGAQQTMQAGMGPAMGLMTVYHGSPYAFDRFDMSKIGSGQGAQVQGHGIYFADRPDVADQYRSFAGAGTKGHLYRADIPDAVVGRMLRWDAPLSEQPQAVKDALTNAPFETKGIGDISGATIMDMANSYAGGGGVGAKDPAAGAALLRALGIPGIRYLDGGSRGAGGGTYNTVLFDDSLARILGRE